MTSNQAGLAEQTEITGLTCDSRRVMPGFLFAALPGGRADGEAFIDEALNKGAVALLARPGIPPRPVPVLEDENPRRRYALLAARFHGVQPETVVGVTGTNGKTSCVNFLRRIWTGLGLRAASLGTLGLSAPGLETKGGLTTPDAAELHRTLAGLKADGVDHLALEASSHGLDQYRLDGVKLAAAAFTNLSRDHLDYHPSMEAYLEAKLRLFRELVKPGGIAVINADSPHADRVVRAAESRGLKIFTFGRAGLAVRLLRASPQPHGQNLDLEIAGREYRVDLPLLGDFQAENVLCALCLAIALGAETKAAVATLAGLKGVPGRLEFVARHPNGAALVVDYAHTPDALARAISALRPHAGGRLVVVFGCGGDRDPGKRPEMGRIAAEKADRIIVTDDNPRTEGAAAIRRAIIQACPTALEIADRGQAIRLAAEGLGPDDILLIAGKGHESGQIVGDQILPFDDREAARKAVAGLVPLWTSGEAALATGGIATSDWRAYGVVIDSRTVRPGDLFVALAGPNFDGHAFVGDALRRGAAAALVARRPEGLAEDAPLLLVEDTMRALENLARAARGRAKARVVGVTGSVGKTGVKEALRLALEAQGTCHATQGNLNNHWGLPLSLARLSPNADYAVLEMGMNHAGEIAPLSALARPHVTVITTVEAVHSAHFPSTEAIAEAKAEIFTGQEKDGTAVLNRDNPHFARLSAAARDRGLKVIGFGLGEEADVRGLEFTPDADGSNVLASIGGREIAYRVGINGRHWVPNSLAVLAAAGALGADVGRAAESLALLKPAKGRGLRHRLRLESGEFILIDESYNASPASVGAAIDSLSRMPGRRVLVLGDMLELGPDSGDRHAALAKAVVEAGIEVVFTAGRDTARLDAALPPQLLGGHAPDSKALAPLVAKAIRPGDVVTVKGSAGSRMGVVVDALLALGGGR